MDEKNNSKKKKRFTTPEQIKFTKKISVKSLPKTTSPFVKPTEELSIKKEEALIKPSKVEEHETNLTDEIVANKDFNFIDKLQQLLEKRGSTLNSGLCEKFISEMLRSFEKPLKFEDLEYAAECFVRIEKNRVF
ncbi:MAG: hypothetical protein ACFFDO_06430 [Candidatus Thorarchaeota archaeon]